MQPYRCDQSSRQKCVPVVEAVFDDHIKHNMKLHHYPLSQSERSYNLLATQPAAWKMPILLVIALLRLLA